MANDVKWIKLMVGMFDGMSFKKIKRAKIGGESYRDKLTAVWFELMDFAGKCNHDGMFISPREIPFKDLADIAMMIDRDEQELELCMAFFINEGMVTVIDDVYMLSNWAEYQNIEGLDKIREQNRIRQRRWQAKQKALGSGEVCSYCGGTATGHDHVLALSRGGTDTDSNKVPCCIECNRMKNDKPLVDFLNYNRERINDDLVTQNLVLQRFVTLDNVSNRYVITQPNGTDIDKERDTDREGDNKSNKGRYRFTPPSLDEVKDYCKERGNKVDAERWFDYYTSNGWKVGKNTMKDWKAAVRTWERSGDRSGNNETTGDTQQSGKYGVWL